MIRLGIAITICLAIVIIIWRVVRTNERRKELAKLRSIVEEIRTYTLAQMDVDPTAASIYFMITSKELESK